jgi:hypothetical protein
LPTGWLFTLGNLLKIPELAQVFVHLGGKKDVYKFLPKNGLGNMLGNFQKNASGHPGWTPFFSPFSA